MHATLTLLFSHMACLIHCSPCLIGVGKDYTMVHYLRIPSHNQSLIAYMILTFVVFLGILHYGSTFSIPYSCDNTNTRVHTCIMYACSLPLNKSPFSEYVKTPLKVLVGQYSNCFAVIMMILLL